MDAGLDLISGPQADSVDHRPSGRTELVAVALGRRISPQSRWLGAPWTHCSEGGSLLDGRARARRGTQRASSSGKWGGGEMEDTHTSGRSVRGLGQGFALFVLDGVDGDFGGRWWWWFVRKWFMQCDRYFQIITDCCCCCQTPRVSILVGGEMVMFQMLHHSNRFGTRF